MAVEHIKVYSFYVQYNFNVESKFNLAKYDLVIKYDVQWRCNRMLASWWFRG